MEVWLSGEAWDRAAAQELVSAVGRNEISRLDVLSEMSRAKDNLGIEEGSHDVGRGGAGAEEEGDREGRVGDRRRTRRR